MNNFYVYIHKKVVDNVVFYVGKGSGPRAYRFDNRGAKYKEILNNSGGIIVEKIAENLTEVAALEIEHKYINNPPNDWQLINTLKNSRTKIIDLNNIRLKLIYDETSPSFLRWNIDAPFSKSKKGDIAGWYSSADGYYRIQIDNATYLAHRVVWFLFNDVQDENLVINHIDNNRSNNNITNLECISKEHNTLKSKTLNKNGLRPNNTSGYNNIREVSTGDGILARISSEKYKRISKYFSYNKYTKEGAMRLAIEWYEKKQEEILNLRLQS